jgi:all-trans-8'-apo-beta-carotenal 15,15'-oxygenase
MFTGSRCLLLFIISLRQELSNALTVTTYPKVHQERLIKAGGDEAAYISSYVNGKECVPTRVEMEIPSDFPSGTYFRNGAGKFIAEDGTKVMHMFDGDGLINALTIQGYQDSDVNHREVIFRNKFVQTSDYQTDMKTGGFSARGVFGTPKSGGLLSNAFDMKTKNVANTNVILCGDKLLALWEGGSPYELDPRTLDTIRERNDVENFAAHPRYDPVNKVWINFGVSDPDPVKGTTEIQLYEMDAQTGLIRSQPVKISVPGVALCHDAILTENYVIISWNLCNVNGAGAIQALLGIGPIAGALALDPSGQHILLCIPRNLLKTGAILDGLTDDRIKRVEAPFGFAFHFGNGYENENGHIILDRIETDDRNFDFGLSMLAKGNGKPIWEVVPWDAMKPYNLVRFQIDPQNELLLDRKVLCATGSIEFPTILPSLSTLPHKYLYTVASHNPFSPKYGFGGSFCKIDASTGEILATFSGEPNELVAEPCLIAKVGGSEEDDAYLLSFITDGIALTSDVLILDAKSLNVVTRARLPTFVPNGGLHGRFVEGATYDFSDIMTTGQL